MSIHVTPPTQQACFSGSSGMLDIASDSYGDDFVE